jgi:ABC-2 type transport system permease protein
MNAFLMLMRRENWEHRAIRMVPTVLGLLIVVSALAAVGVTQSWRESATVRIITTSEHEQAIERSRERVQRLAGELAAVAMELAADRTSAALEDAARQAEQHALALEEALREAGVHADEAAVRRLEEAAARAAARALELERALESARAPESPQAPRPPAAESPPAAPAGPDGRRVEIERLRAAIGEEARRIAEHERGLRQEKAGDGGDEATGDGEAITLREFITKYASVGRTRMREVAGDLMFGSAGLFFAVTAWIMFFYALAALYDERKDRSALFWKSLPVSDLLTVGSKTATALVTAPLFAFAAVAVTQLALMLMASVVVWRLDLDVAGLVWGAARPWALWPQMLASFLVQSLWLAPVIAWALLVSAWSRRTPVLHALLVPAVLGLLEFLLFRSRHFLNVVGERLSRGVLVVVDSTTTAGGEVTVRSTIRAMDADALGAMLASASFWAGLVVAAAFIAGAVWIRRYRDEA